MVVIFYLSRLVSIIFGLALGLAFAWGGSVWAGAIIGLPRGISVGCLAGGYPIMATPAIVGDRFYVRSAHNMWAFGSEPTRQP